MATAQARTMETVLTIEDYRKSNPNVEFSAALVWAATQDRPFQALHKISTNPLKIGEEVGDVLRTADVLSGLMGVPVGVTVTLKIGEEFVTKVVSTSETEPLRFLVNGESVVLPLATLQYSNISLLFEAPSNEEVSLENVQGIYVYLPAFCRQLVIRSCVQVCKTLAASAGCSKVVEDESKINVKQDVLRQWVGVAN